MTPPIQKALELIEAIKAADDKVALYQCELEDGRIEHFAGIFGEVHEVNGVRVVKRLPLYASPVDLSAMSETLWQLVNALRRQ